MGYCPPLTVAPKRAQSFCILCKLSIYKHKTFLSNQSTQVLSHGYAPALNYLRRVSVTPHSFPKLVTNILWLSEQLSKINGQDIPHLSKISDQHTVFFHTAAQNQWLGYDVTPNTCQKLVSEILSSVTQLPKISGEDMVSHHTAPKISGQDIVSHQQKLHTFVA